MLNNITIAGRLTADPKLSRTKSDKDVASFCIACDRDFSKDTDFFNVTAWEKLAEFAGKYLFKGTSVTVLGRLQTRSYEKDGQKRVLTEIVAERVYFNEKRNVSTSTFEDLGDGDGGDLPF
jgi:single-strand DNA-binding protein